jgi:antitoxin YefM
VTTNADDRGSWRETEYLLRSPANARRLLEAVARDRAGDTGVTVTMAEPRETAGDG